MLKTQRRSSSSILSFSSNLRLLSQQLASSDSDMRALLRVTPPAARATASLIREIGTPLGVTISNLTSTAQVFQANVRGVQELLIQVPRAVDIGSSRRRADRSERRPDSDVLQPAAVHAGLPRHGAAQRAGHRSGPAAEHLRRAAPQRPVSDVRGSQHVPSNTGVIAPWLSSYAGDSTVSVNSLAQLMGS